MREGFILKHIEIELKHLMDKSDLHLLYRHLMAEGRTTSITRQINYYFDTKDGSMQKQCINFRVRTIGDTAELTCKIPNNPLNDSIQSCYEYNWPLSHALAIQYIQKGIPKSELKDLAGTTISYLQADLSDLICLGHLKTTRIAFYVLKGMDPLLLDINTYLGHFDYELEWEISEIDRGQLYLCELFKALNIKPIFPMQSKRNRYFKRLNQRQNNP